MENQSKLDNLYTQLVSGGITRHDYVKAINHIKFTDSERRQLAGRRDIRDAGHFAMALHDNTLREKFLVNEWCGLFRDETTIEDHGIDNKGRLVLFPRGKNRTPDYLLTVYGIEYYLEVKFAPHQGFVTYKEDDLINYQQTENLIVLTMMSPDKMVGSNGDPGQDVAFVIPENMKWFLMGEQEVTRVLEDGQSGNHYGFGGKPTRRVFNDQFDDFFVVCDWVGDLVFSDVYSQMQEVYT